MNFPFNCLGCGHENRADWSRIGRQVFCRKCRRPAIVPAPMEPAAEESKAAFAVRFACPFCGRHFATKPGLLGQKIRCTGCGAGVRVPAANSFPVEYAARVALNAIARATDTSTGPGIAPVTVPGAGVSPPAGRSIPAGNPPRIASNGDHGSIPTMDPVHGETFWAIEDDSDSDSELDSAIERESPSVQIEAVEALSHREQAAVVLPSRAQTLEQVRQEEARQETVEPTTEPGSPKKGKGKKKRRKKTGYFDAEETRNLVLGAAVVVGVLAFLAWRFPEFRFPLGGLLAVMGAVIYLLGAMSLRRIAQKETFLKSLAYRIFPPYQLWFVLTHWEETQDFFAFVASGLVIVAIGVGVVSTSPTAKRAAESEREYQRAVDTYVRGDNARSRIQATPKTANPGR